MEKDTGTKFGDLPYTSTKNILLWTVAVAMVTRFYNIDFYPLLQILLNFPLQR